MTTLTDYGNCFLISSHAYIKTVKQNSWEYDHLFKEDGTPKNLVKNLKSKEVEHWSYQIGKTKVYSADIPTLFVELEYKMDGDPYLINWESALYENHETLEELEKIRDEINDSDFELNQEQLDLINAFHNGYGCTSLSQDYDVDYDYD